jgi:cobyrinic acid a,c-diamide synthase
MKVVGAVQRNPALEIGERHLGLTTPAETGALGQKIGAIGAIVGGSVDLDLLIELAGSASNLPDLPARAPDPTPDVTIAIARDRAFGFYYPDDLEAFAAAGARLVPFDSMKDSTLPACDGLFIGGGFPEMFVAELVANQSLRTDIRAKIEAGLPSYAECGGLMYLCRSIKIGESTGAMVGVVPADAVMHKRPQGRGYTAFRNTDRHPWPDNSDTHAAHEFHYARLENTDAPLTFAREVLRGHGVDGEHDGIVIHNLLAGFCHLRATGPMPWVARFVDFVRAHKAGK